MTTTPIRTHHKVSAARTVSMETNPDDPTEVLLTDRFRAFSWTAQVGDTVEITVPDVGTFLGEVEDLVPERGWTTVRLI